MQSELFSSDEHSTIWHSGLISFILLIFFEIMQYVEFLPIPLNISEKFILSLTIIFFMLIYFNFRHWVNILEIVVTFDKSKIEIFIDVNDEQPLNIWYVVVTWEVLKKEKIIDVNDEQPLNIYEISVTWEVSKKKKLLMLMMYNH